MSKTITTKKGRKITLLNPAEKGEKFSTELRSGICITNDGEVKSKNGEIKILSDIQKAYRSGYLDSRRDSAKCYNSKMKKKK